MGARADRRNLDTSSYLRYARRLQTTTNRTEPISTAEPAKLSTRWCANVGSALGVRAHDGHQCEHRQIERAHHVLLELEARIPHFAEPDEEEPEYQPADGGRKHGNDSLLLVMGPFR